jgi:hypothetical protein
VEGVISDGHSYSNNLAFSMQPLCLVVS